MRAILFQSDSLRGSATVRSVLEEIREKLKSGLLSCSVSDNNTSYDCSSSAELLSLGSADWRSCRLALIPPPVPTC